LNRHPFEEEALAHITPRKEESDLIKGVADRLLEAVEASGKARGMVVGSVARNTWVRGDRDLDIFMLFDPATPREELEEEGLALGRKIARQFGSGAVEKFAEHPYINTVVEGLDVDLVPCYAVADSHRIQSAVDRTPFHTRYIQEHINGLEGDVLLAKQFAKTSGIYGSDQMTEGFSGYLCELLVIHYGGFSSLLRALAGWRPGTCIDMEGHGTREFADPLVVIDPVDPKRNVAASVSRTRMFEFVELARGYLANPSLDFFFPPIAGPIDRMEFERVLAERETYLYAVEFPAPDLVPDILVPQLRKSTDAIADMLRRYEFSVNRTDSTTVDGRCILLFELLVSELPPVKTHMGPQIWDADHADRFVEKYAEGNVYAGPFIEGDRYYVEKVRRHTSAEELLSSPSPLKLSLGKHVKKEMERGWNLRVGPDVWKDSLAPFLSAFLQRRSPLMRIRYEQTRRKDEPIE
jgi:tRNA nucleotidyltransferase (CCA-adding enzyme)